MATLEELRAAIGAAEQQLAIAEAALSTWESFPENNQYHSLNEAAPCIEDILRDRAYEDCEGSYNCGLEEYVQDFMVGLTVYRGTLKCEYNRHDKTYYYLEHTTFSYAPV
jgi:hypothetical protein